MARVTVEDCIVKIPNRFELVLTAARRARDIAAGALLSVDRDNDKNPVVALREIADATINIPLLQESLITGMQKHIEVDEPEEDFLEFMATEQLMLGAKDAELDMSVDDEDEDEEDVTGEASDEEGPAE